MLGVKTGGVPLGFKRGKMFLLVFIQNPLNNSTNIIVRKKEKFEAVLAHFRATMDATETELHYSNPFELIVAVVLSAQCTDKRVNMVTPRLFRDYPTAECMAQASEADILEHISSVSYPNSKAAHLLGLSKKLVEQYGGEVPGDFDALVGLPGVGRKTANVVLAVAFKQQTLAVDTHVFRVSHRLGLVPPSAKTPYAVEQALRKYLPPEEVAASHYWILLHGRYVCTARKPHCDRCAFTAFCPTYGKEQNRSAT